MNKKDKLKMLIAVLMDLLCAAAVIVFYFNPSMFNKVNEFVVYAVISFLIMVVLLLTYAIVDFVWHKQNYEGRYGFGAVFLSHVELFSYGFIAFWFMVYEGLLTLYGWEKLPIVNESVFYILVALPFVVLIGMYYFYTLAHVVGERVGYRVFSAIVFGFSVIYFIYENVKSHGSNLFVEQIPALVFMVVVMTAYAIVAGLKSSEWRLECLPVDLQWSKEIEESYHTMNNFVSQYTSKVPSDKVGTILKKSPEDMTDEDKVYLWAIANEMVEDMDFEQIKDILGIGGVTDDARI